MILLPNPQTSVDSYYNETYKTHKLWNESNPAVLEKKSKCQDRVSRTLQYSCIKVSQIFI